MPKKSRNVKLLESVNIEKIGSNMIIKTSVPLEKCTVQEHLTKEQISVLSPWMKPKEPFAKLLKSVGAEGHESNLGEIFTLKQITHYLKEYIKIHMLYDENDPRMVFCSKDQLGEVLQVVAFTVFDAPSLIWKNVTPLEIDYKQLASSPIIHVKQASLSEAKITDSVVNEEFAHSSVSPEIASSVPSSVIQRVDSRKRKLDSPFTNCQNSSNECLRVHEEEKIVHNDLGIKKTCLNDSYLSRQSQNSDTEGTDVLSIMSKETAYIQDSTDDFWFLEDEQSFDNESILLASSSLPASSDVDENLERTNDQLVIIESRSSHYEDKDEDCWADSEFSDVDTDVEEENNYSKDDYWFCSQCDTWNSPICRFCGRCFRVRSGWLKEDSLNNTCSDEKSSKALVNEIRDENELLSKNKNIDFLNSVDSSDIKQESGSCSAANYSQSMMYPKNSQTSIDSGFLSSSPKSKKLCTAHASNDVFTDISSQDENNLDFKISNNASKYIINLNLDTIDSSLNKNEIHSDSIQLPCPNRSKSDINVNKLESKTHTDSDNMCVVCLSRPKTSCLIHGKTSHQACCFQCAKKLRRNGNPCPICRKKIQRVVRNFIV